jgi:hypothetical protein
MLLFICTLAGGRALAQGSPSVVPEVMAPDAGLERYLNPDGTLNLNAGASGGIDARGWRMTLGPDGAPRFSRVTMLADSSLDTAGSRDGYVPGDEGWDDRFGMPGSTGIIYAMAVAGDNVYVAGRFNSIGNIDAANIACWSRSARRWTPLREGTGGAVHALAVLGDDLYVGGLFEGAGGLKAPGIARWNMTSKGWFTLGAGISIQTSGPPKVTADLPGHVNALVIHGSDLYVAGQFDYVDDGSKGISHLARWNGTDWSRVTPLPLQPLFAMAGSGDDLYVGGTFKGLAGDSAISNIARFNFTTETWSGVGGGVNGTVYALAAGPDGIYAGGAFTTAGGAAAAHIARWSGSAWSPLGRGLDGTVMTLTVDGDAIYAGGTFAISGGRPLNCIARWKDDAWSSLGVGMGLSDNGKTQWIPGVSGIDQRDQLIGSLTDPFVSAIAVAGGEVFAGGHFTSAGSVTARFIARWGDGAWHQLAASDDTLASLNRNGTDGSIYCVAIAGGSVYVGGDFTYAGNVRAHGVARWDWGTGRWYPLGSGLDGPGAFVRALAVLGGDLYIGGGFSSVSGVPASGIARWDGARWSAVGGGVGGPNPFVFALATRGDELFAGGDFTSAGGAPASGIARWSRAAGSWSPLGEGVMGLTTARSVTAIAATPDAIYIGGNFTNAGNVRVNNVARWDGARWSPLGSGLASGVDGPVAALVADSAGAIYAGGEFLTAGGKPARYLARWDSASGWKVIPGDPLSAPVHSLAIADGDLIAGGEFTAVGNKGLRFLARRSALGWSSAGSDGRGLNGPVHALAAAPGALYAGGEFTSAAGIYARFVAELNGGRWNSLGADPQNGLYGRVIAVAMRAGHVYIGGAFGVVGGMRSGSIAHWDGERWLPVGESFNGPIRAIAVDDAGGAYVGGEFTRVGSLPVNGVAYWNGSAWSALGDGLGGGAPYAYGLALSGEYLYVGGGFSTAGGVRSNHIARWHIPSQTWSAMGPGVGGSPQFTYVASVAAAGSDVYIGGYFPTAGDVKAENVARWDGARWLPLGDGLNNSVYALAAGRNGEVYVGGDFHAAGNRDIRNVAMWNGHEWSGMGALFTRGSVYSVAVGASDVYIGGDFSFSPVVGVRTAFMGRWDGSAWRNIGRGAYHDFSNGAIYALAAAGSDLYVGGDFTVIGGKASYDFGHWVRSAASSVPSTSMAASDRGALLLAPGVPNPFSSSTTLRFTLPEGGVVNLTVYDPVGRRVATLVDGAMSAGSHDVLWAPPADLSDGLYYSRLRTARGVEARPITLLRR